MVTIHLAAWKAAYDADYDTLALLLVKHGANLDAKAVSLKDGKEYSPRDLYEQACAPQFQVDMKARMAQFDKVVSDNTLPTTSPRISTQHNTPPYIPPNGHSQ